MIHMLTADAVGDLKQNKSAKFEQRRKTFIKSYRYVTNVVDLFLNMYYFSINVYLIF